MDNNKLNTTPNLFEGKEIRSVWDSKKEEYYFSVVDVISALTDSKISKRYWSYLKRKLTEEGRQLYENIVQLKMLANDGKMREKNALDIKEILRLIEWIPSKNAELFKLWLAQMDKENALNYKYIEDKKSKKRNNLLNFFIQDRVIFQIEIYYIGGMYCEKWVRILW